MRIVGGIYKGRNLVSFYGEKIRPTSDMAREALFNIISSDIIDRNFLDLFCGTGAMGLEALSRGAKSVILNDIDRESISVVKKNLEKLKVENGVTVSIKDGLTYLKTTGEKFDFIYIDPPYKSDLGVKALELCESVLSDGGRVIFESEEDFNGEINGLTVVDKRKYGRVRLTFFQKAL